MVDAVGPAAVSEAAADARAAGPTDAVQPAHPVSQRLIRAWLDVIVTRSVVEGVERLALGGAPIVVVSNHLSFVDTTATECAWIRAG
ncbi:MAG: hypothetical protein ABMB14_37370, partial [Myxococcota bacterium]